MSTKTLPNSAQNLIYLVIIIIAIALYYVLQPAPVSKPHGILLPAQAKKQAAINPNDVKIYRQPPMQFVNGGTIRVSTHISTEHLGPTLKENIAYAKTLAAQAGYNGLLITAIGTTSKNPSPLDEEVLWAKAIQVQNPTSSTGS